MIELAAGMALGLAASGHCVAMCGPLMLAVRHASEVHALANRRRAMPFALYQVGRVAGYAILGLVAGATGAAIAGTAEIGRAISFAAAVGLTVMAAGHAGLPVPDPIGRRVGRIIGRALRAVRGHAVCHPCVTSLAAGGLTALLPCGLLYAGLVASAALANAGQAAAFMMAYGAGTLPLLGVMAWAENRIPDDVRTRLRLLTPVLLLALAVLLVARGAGPSTLAASAAHMHGH
jgi:sulfite exporter TauE/SafE